MNKIIITLPDDWHIHLREGEMLINTVKDAEQQFGKILVMPNLKNPIVNTEMALSYYKQICQYISNRNLQVYLTLYLTDNTTVEEIIKAHNSGIIKAVKLYPAGATTNSDNGVTNINKLGDVIAKLEELEMTLCLHGEVVDKEIDIFYREQKFIDNTLTKLRTDFPKLKIVLEHATTKEAVDFVKEHNNIAATITPQHLLYNRNDLLVGGIKPHFYCLPILKSAKHQEALIKAAISGNRKFFAGTDSAPHLRQFKEASCGCAGCYSAHNAIEYYAQAFHRYNALDKLESFTSFFGSDFYKLPRNSKKITLVQQQQQIPNVIQWHTGEIVPLAANTLLDFSINNSEKTEA